MTNIKSETALSLAAFLLGLCAGLFTALHLDFRLITLGIFIAGLPIIILCGYLFRRVIAPYANSRNADNQILVSLMRNKSTPTIVRLVCAIDLTLMAFAVSAMMFVAGVATASFFS